MNQKQILKEVQDMRKKGKSPEEIMSQLLLRGFSAEQIVAVWHEFQPQNQQKSSKITADRLQQHVIRVLFAIGVLLVTAGIFSIVAENWAFMSRWARTALLVSILVLAQGVALLGERKQWSPRVTQSAHVIAFMTFGANIFLIAQIFNISHNWADGFLLWSLGGLAAVWARRSIVITLGTLGVAIFGLLPYIDDFMSFSRYYFEEANPIYRIMSNYDMQNMALLLMCAIIFAYVAHTQYKKLNASS